VIAWYVGIRTLPLLAVLRVVLLLSFHISSGFGTNVLIIRLQFLGEAGAWTNGMFLLTIAMGTDLLVYIYRTGVWRMLSRVDSYLNRCKASTVFRESTT
jgi:hypothetical protein